MKNISIIHLGLGRVGSKVMELLSKNHPNLKYVATFTSKKSQPQITPVEAINNVKKPFIVIDTTASDKTYNIIKLALKKGGYAVLSNKKPLSSTQINFDNLIKTGKNRLFFETTVGAGLPVISTLKNLLFAGDQIIEIEGCFSGTLGFIAFQLESGLNYSEAIKQAKELGYTEPDPRDDLSGLDVARKALILARLLELKLELDDIKRTSFYDPSLDKLTIEDFLKETKQSDKKYGKLFAEAKKENMTYRYVASININKGVTVGLKKISKISPIGSLQGPDNIIVFKTKYYNKNPLVVQGPGAGIEVTAAGVVGDILQITRCH